MLKKPDTNKPVFRIFPEARESVREGKCPFCGKDIKEEEFVDALSKQEFSVSGLCQKCQDKMLKEQD